MGVMTCNRNGCSCILCDHYSSEYGYLCNDCFAELTEKPFTNIKEFMDSKIIKTDPFDREKWVEILNYKFNKES
jgi:putative NIF3 family GTP cyclohydrolase 1 type 2